MHFYNFLIYIYQSNKISIEFVAKSSAAKALLGAAQQREQGGGRRPKSTRVGQDW